MPRGGSNFKDRTNERVGRLTVISRAENYHNGQARWLCRCDCGNERVVLSGNLRVDKTYSCGCGKLEQFKARFTTHGMSKHPIHKAWCGLLGRCRNPKDAAWQYYGGRGIKVCKRWLKFENFRDDMLEAWRPGLEIDRIDNDGNYEPGNCRWATLVQQMRNRRGVRRIEYEGVTRTMSEWAERIGIDTRVLWSRIKKGVPLNIALFVPNMRQMNKEHSQHVAAG